MLRTSIKENRYNVVNLPFSQRLLLSIATPRIGLASTFAHALP
jgi:hypothetical protein